MRHLAYELVVTNVLSQLLTVDGVTVTAEGADLLSLQHEALTPWMRPMGASMPGRVLSPGQQAVITLDVVLAPDAEVPQSLSHMVELTPEQAMPPLVEASMIETIAVTRVDDDGPIVIGSPVRGANWLDGNSCCEVTPHRAAINPINGRLFAPERFAIDFVQLDAAGRIFNGAIDDLASYAFYGAEIVAVGDGPIVSMEWDLPESTPGAHPTGLTLAQYGGNHIVQDLGDGHYAFYAHLQGGNPQALAVGQQLTAGNLIGQLGNSGNSDMPHLHFHVMDSPLPLGSNGLPFLIDEFTLDGTLTEANLQSCMSAPVSCGVDATDPTPMKAKSPLYRDVITIGK